MSFLKAKTSNESCKTEYYIIGKIMIIYNNNNKNKYLNKAFLHGMQALEWTKPRCAAHYQQTWL